METAEAENKAAVEQAFPDGYGEIQVGVSDVAFLNWKTDVFPTQRKPKRGEEVTCSQLRDDLMVRVWGGI